jgi:hypothetical protein
MFLSRPEDGLAVILDQTLNGDAVDAEHQSLHTWADASEITYCFNKTCLERGDVGDFQERVDIVQVNLP